MGSSEFCFCKFAWNLRIVFLFSPFPHYQHLSVTDSNNAFKITSLLEVNFNIPFLMEKEMATHSSTLAWKIRWMEKPGRLQSMESQSRTRLSDLTSLSYGPVLSSRSACFPNGFSSHNEKGAIAVPGQHGHLFPSGRTARRHSRLPLCCGFLLQRAAPRRASSCRCFHISRLGDCPAWRSGRTPP